MNFIRYDKYKLGRWNHDPRYQMSIIGEIDDMYIVWDHDFCIFTTWMKRNVTIIDNSDDVNFQNAYCIYIKGVYHSIRKFEDKLKDAVERELSFIKN